MTRKPLLSKLNIAMIVLLIAASAILVTENVTGATIRDSLAGFTRVNEDVVPAESSLTRLERRYELARIKDDVFPADSRLVRLERLHEIARIKDDVIPADSRLVRLERLHEIARIKDDITP